MTPEEENALRQENSTLQEQVRTQHALAESIQRIFVCPNCGVQFTHAQILHRRERGFDTLICIVCDTIVSIADRDEKLTEKSLAMNRSADTQREHEAAVSLQSASRPRNPYYEMSGLRNPTMFVGRTELMRRMFSAVVNQQSVSIVGSIHIGKSSLLQHLSRLATQRQFGYDLWSYPFVILDLGEFLYKTSEEFFQDASGHIVAQSHGALHMPQGVRGSNAFRAVLEQAVEQGFHTVLLMDSFDNVVRNKSFDAGFFDFLRALASAGKISYIITSTAPLSDICHDSILGSPFFNIFNIYRLGSLTREEAQQLIWGPSRLAGYPFTDAEAAWVLSLAGSHPFFIQRVCYFLFEEKMTGNDMADLQRLV